MAAKLMGVKEISSNRKAFHEYFVLERFEAGIELCGTEVKSIRAGNVNLRNFARSQFCVLILIAILFGICTALGIVGGS